MGTAPHHPRKYPSPKRESAWRVTACRSRFGRDGWSLTELLTVIAIIAVILAIALPVFSRATESGRRSTCASNLRQIGIALNMYADDWDGAYPWNERPSGPSGTPAGDGDFPTLRYCAKRYILNTGNAQCPSDRTLALQLNLSTGEPVRDAGGNLVRVPQRAGISNAILYYDDGAGTKGAMDASVRASYDVLVAHTKFIRNLSAKIGYTNVPLAWDYCGGLTTERLWAAVPSSRPESERGELRRQANHYPSGGNVVYAGGQVRWKSAAEWKDINDPGIPTDLLP